MSSNSERNRLEITWFSDARSDLRAVQRDIAMQILYCLNRYMDDRKGDVKKLKSPYVGFRLRCGDYRVFFDQSTADGIVVTAVRHRREAYR